MQPADSRPGSVQRALWRVQELVLALPGGSEAEAQAASRAAPAASPAAPAIGGSCYGRLAQVRDALPSNAEPVEGLPSMRELHTVGKNVDGCFASTPAAEVPAVISG